MADEGRGVVLITHKLDEVLAGADRVTILRASRHVGTFATNETTAGALTALMIGSGGRAVRLHATLTRRYEPVGSVTVKLERTSIPVDTEDLEWLQHRLANRPTTRENTALMQKLAQVLAAAEPRTLVLSEAEAGFVLVNLEGLDELPGALRELRNGIEQES
jgi:ABC-type uncharacterized transport system ATPase subunit